MSEELQQRVSDIYGNLELDSDIEGMFFSDLIMLNLIVSKPMRLHRIAKETGYTPQSVGRHCGRMAKDGLILVKVDRRDKRAKLASITKKGANVQARCKDFIDNRQHSK